MKKVITLSILVFFLMGSVSCTAQGPSVFPKDLKKLEYKFNKDEVIVYKTVHDVTVKSDYEYLKQATGSEVTTYYLIEKVEDATKKNVNLKVGGVVERKKGYKRLGGEVFFMDTKGAIKNLLTDYWFQINQPVFPKKNKEQWESSLAIKPYNKGPKDPTIDTIAKYKVMGTTKINGKECLIIDSHISFKEIIKGKSRNNEIELVDTATTFFDYKAGRVIKMDIDYHYKITAIDGDTRLVIRDEKATLKHELSDREFTPGQLNAWLYNIVPELPIEE